MQQLHSRRVREEAAGHKTLGLVLLGIAFSFILSLAAAFHFDLAGMFRMVALDPFTDSTTAAAAAASRAPSATSAAANQPAAVPTTRPVAVPQPAAVEPAPSAAGSCAPGQRLAFEGGFSRLKQALGSTMGEPLECARLDERSGDILQRTTRGLAAYNAASGTLRFTDGWKHYELAGDRLITWEGADSPPLAAAEPTPSDAPRSRGPDRPSRASASDSDRTRAATLSPPTASDSAQSRAATRTSRRDDSEDGRETYVIRRGDQLKHIAARYGVDLWELARANNIPDPDALRVGQELIIPGRGPRSDEVGE